MAIAILNLACTEFLWIIGVYHFILQLVSPSLQFAQRTSALENGSVALLYLTKNDFVELAALSCVQQQYASFHVYLLDDSDNADVRRKIDRFHDQHFEDTTLIRRSSHCGYKAGNLNHALSQIHWNHDFFAIADADTRLPPSFLTEALSYFADQRVGFVQALHRTSSENVASSLSSALVPFTELYWRGIVLRSCQIGFVMFHGHGGVIRMQAWRDVGGFPEVVSEDLAFSTAIRQRGYRGVIAGKTVCDEEFPSTYRAFCRRQRKYVRGACEHLTHGMAGFVTCRSVPLFERIDRCVGTMVLLAPCVAAFSLIALAVTPAGVNRRFAAALVGAITTNMCLGMQLPAVRTLWREPLSLLKFMLCSSIVHLSLTFRATYDFIKTAATGSNTFPVTGDPCGDSTSTKPWFDMFIDVIGLGVCSLVLVRVSAYGAVPIAIALFIGIALQLVGEVQSQAEGSETMRTAIKDPGGHFPADLAMRDGSSSPLPL